MDGAELTDDMWPERYVPDWQEAERTNSEEFFMKHAFYLLREATHLTSIVASLSTEASGDRNRAIRRGLMVRLTKLMRLMLRELMAEETFQQLSVSRSLIETVATLNYLLEDSGSGERYDKYVQNSLVAEREVLQDIVNNVSRRDGTVWHIEQRMQRSIDKTAKAGGVEDVSTLPGRRTIGFPSAEARVQALGFGAYTAYRMGSTEVHGDWTDLYRNHLEYKDGHFSPNFEPYHPRPQIPLTIAGTPIYMLQKYLTQLVDQPSADQVLLPKLRDLYGRIERLNQLHEDFLQRL